MKQDGALDAGGDGEPLFARGGAYMTKEIEQEMAVVRDRVLGEIDRLDLWKAVGELDASGFTVIPPEQAAPAGFADAVREALLDVAEKQSGVRPDVEGGQTHANILSRHGQVELIEPLIHRHPIFPEALLNERAQALVTYLLGESSVLFSSTGQLKGPGKHYLPLHADEGISGGPAPFSPVAHVCNAVWILSDYNADNGATCLVPGSHKLCRHPTYAEVKDMSLYKPLEAKAGSILVWHGNTWHGAVPRKNPGLRLGIIQYFGRWYNGRGTFAKLFTKDEVARHPPRFAQLIGANPTPGLDFRMPPPVAMFSQFG